MKNKEELFTTELTMFGWARGILTQNCHRDTMVDPEELKETGNSHEKTATSTFF